MAQGPIATWGWQACTLTVLFVQEGGAGAVAGMMASDTIISIDGKRVSELTVEIAGRLLAMGRISAGQAVLLGVERGGQILPIKVIATKV